MSSHEAHEKRHKAHILMSKRGKKMSFLEIQMALLQFDFINKRKGAPRALRRQSRALNNKLLPKRKVPYNSSNDADDEDFESDSLADSDSNPDADMDGKIDVTKNLAREFRDNPIFDPYEPYLSTCSSMESLTASDREQSVKRMRAVRKLHKRRRCGNHLFFMGMLNEPINTPHDADDEDDSPANIDSNYSSGFDENEWITSSEDSEDDEEDIIMYEPVKRKIDEARPMFAEPGSSQSSDEQASNQEFYDMRKRQRLMVSEDELTDGNSS